MNSFPFSAHHHQKNGQKHYFFVSLSFSSGCESMASLLLFSPSWNNSKDGKRKKGKKRGKKKMSWWWGTLLIRVIDCCCPMKYFRLVPFRADPIFVTGSWWNRFFPLFFHFPPGRELYNEEKTRIITESRLYYIGQSSIDFSPPYRWMINSAAGVSDCCRPASRPGGSGLYALFRPRRRNPPFSLPQLPTSTLLTIQQ